MTGEQFSALPAIDNAEIYTAFWNHWLTVFAIAGTIFGLAVIVLLIMIWSDLPTS